MFSFLRAFNGVAQDSELVVIGADGTGPDVITDDLDDSRDPVWSPDAQKILYADASGNDASGTFHTINPDGTGDATLAADRLRPGRGLRDA